MTGVIFAIIVIFLLIGIGIKLTGALISAVVWVLIKLPIAIVLWLLGLVMCITIILIPAGKMMFKAGNSLLR